MNRADTCRRLPARRRRAEEIANVSSQNPLQIRKTDERRAISPCTKRGTPEKSGPYRGRRKLTDSPLAFKVELRNELNCVRAMKRPRESECCRRSIAATSARRPAGPPSSVTMLALVRCCHPLPHHRRR
jgi:hypothetical protein